MEQQKHRQTQAGSFRSTALPFRAMFKLGWEVLVSSELGIKVTIQQLVYSCHLTSLNLVLEVRIILP